MCTLVAIRNVHREFPLVIAANRDELTHRPSEAPAVRWDHPRIRAGRDAERGGTWMGVTDDGFFVGVTNQRAWAPAHPGLRSRGEVVFDALRDNRAEAVIARLRALDPTQYNSFNLLFGDARELYVAYVRRDPAEVTIEAVPDGVHALANDRMGSPDFPKAPRVEQRLRDPALAELPWNALAPRLIDALRDHELPDLTGLADPPEGAWLTPELTRQLQALCIHVPGYGTVSATLLALQPGRVAHYDYAAGPPCVTPFTPVAP